MKRRGTFDPAVSQAWTLLAWRARYSPTVMARNAKISMVHLRRLCAEYWGEPLVSWLIGQRVLAAQQLLREGIKVKEVATMLGYRQSTHFSRQFQRLMVGLRNGSSWITCGGLAIDRHTVFHPSAAELFFPQSINDQPASFLGLVTGGDMLW